jgi:hypothetical protein
MALDDEPDSVFKGFMNDAKVEATTPAEEATINNLYTAQLYLTGQRLAEGLRRGRISAASRTAEELEAALESDHDLNEAIKEEQSCRTAMATMLRSRVYRLVTECHIRSDQGVQQ